MEGRAARVFQVPFSTDERYHDKVRNRRADLVSMPAQKKNRVSRHRAPVSNLELRQLRAFVALVENGSVTEASHVLGLAQSTVSEAIATLERELGTVLIAHKRGSRSVVLTPAGRILLPRGRKVLAAVDKTYVAVAKAVESARGVVNIIANESVSTYLLSPVLATVRRHWRNTQFAVSIAACPEVREGVRCGAFDLGLLLTCAKPRSGANASTGSPRKSDGWQVVAPLVRLLIFAAPGHPLAQSAGPPAVRRNSLDSFPVFVSDAAGEYRELLERYFREDEMPGPRLESTGSIEGVTSSVVADPRALGILPSYAIAKEIQMGGVVPLDLRPALPPMQIVALLGSVDLHPSTGELLDEVGKACLIPPPREAKT
jgi:DNA-binding transcriptional LysR family regulator